jgi:aldehyde:ferredoxin oxidoreductase
MGLLKILRVNLSKESIKEEEIEQGDFIGGRGLGVYIASRELDPKVEAFSEGNKIIISNGPLAGTLVPFSGRCNVTSKSPLTGTLFSSNAGGMFSYELSKTGYDVIIIEGKSNDPVYLKVGDDSQIVNATEIWGKTVFETLEFFKKTGLEKGKVACIGPAGENLVRFANIMVQGHRAFGRGGLGSVMGFKKLKAVVLDGSQHKKKKFEELARELRKKIKRISSPLKTQGTSNILAIIQEIRSLPTKNFQHKEFENADMINGDALRKYTLRSDTCYSCIIACKRITRSERYGIVTDGPEYETLAAFGSYICNYDIESIIKANDLCDNMGIDTISMGSAIAHFMEASGKWGDYELAHELIVKTAYRDGIGDKLAEGSARFAKDMGIEAIAVKGMDLPAYHPQGLYGQGLAFVTSNRGADHLYSSYYLEELKRKDREALSKEKIPEIIANENKNAILDSLILCKFSRRFYSIEDFLKLLSITMSRDISEEEFYEMGGKIITEERRFNFKAGITKEDVLPSRISIPGLKEALREYYLLRGWDKEGAPK